MQGIKFKRKTQRMGNSLSVSIPKEIAEFLNITKGSQLTIMADINSRDQKYGAFFVVDNNGQE